MKVAVEKHLNPALARLHMRKLASIPGSAGQPASMAKTSMDGPAVESWIKDMYGGLVTHAESLDKDASFGLARARSCFFRALAKTYEALGWTTEYETIVNALPVLTDYAMGMHSALKMKPESEDYDLVERHLARFVIGKLQLWEGSLTWYDNHCLYVVGQMMRKWGSLRLVSQEVMCGASTSSNA